MLLAVPAQAFAAALFGALSAVRRKRVFHPVGTGYEATFTPVTGALDSPLFADGEPRRALVRMSKGIGLPGRLPDVLGLAIKLVEPEQDLLLASARGRHLLWPAAHAATATYSSILWFRVGPRLVVLGAEPIDEGPRRFRVTADDRVVGYLELGEELPAEAAEDLHFSPANAGAGIEPAGPLNRLRKGAYAGSQALRPEAAEQRS